MLMRYTDTSDISRLPTNPVLGEELEKTTRLFSSGCNYSRKRQIPAEWEEVRREGEREKSNNFLYRHTVSSNLFSYSKVPAQSHMSPQGQNVMILIIY